MNNKSPIIMPPQQAQRVNIQVVPKTEIANVTAQASIKLLRAQAEIMEAIMIVRNCRTIVEASCDAFRQVSLLGTAIDRDKIAGGDELDHLNDLLEHLHGAEVQIKAVTGAQ